MGMADKWRIKDLNVLKFSAALNLSLELINAEGVALSSLSAGSALHGSERNVYETK
jgi:hypothetical protein